MTDTTPAIIKINRLPQWRTDDKGRLRGLSGGRWNQARVKEFLIDHPSWQTMDDIARVVYGSTSKTNRENVRKHIPSQRLYMRNLDQPFVTEYGSHGRIMRIKLYNPASEDDRVKLRVELDRARERKEISEKRYDDLLHVFLLSSGAAL